MLITRISLFVLMKIIHIPFYRYGRKGSGTAQS